MGISNVVLSEKVGKEITSFSNKSEKARRSAGSVANSMYKIGMRVSDCYAPTKGNLADGTSTTNPEQWALLKSYVVLGFDKKWQAALAPATTAGMTEMQKFQRSKAKSEIGAKINDLKAALERRDAIATGGKDSNPKTRKTPDERVIASLANAAKIVEKNTMEFDVADFNKAMEAVSDVIEAGLPDDK